MSQPQSAEQPLHVGAVLDLAEQDYCYGEGRLVIRVTRVVEIMQFDDGSWIAVTGIPLRGDGSAAGRERFALIRMASIGRARPPE